jgi:hypothetical protein
VSHGSPAAVHARAAAAAWLAVALALAGCIGGVKPLKTTSNTDPVVGSGQPESAPGQLCAVAQLAISDWIAAGALEN